MHPRLQSREARVPGGIERDDLAVEHGGQRAEPEVCGGELGIALGDVDAAACTQPHPLAIPCRDGPDAVPLELDPREAAPASGRGGGQRGCRRHGEHRRRAVARRARRHALTGAGSGHGARRRILPRRLRAVQQPLRLLAGARRADQGEAHASERSAGTAGEGRDDLVIPPFLHGEGAGIPHGHGTRPVLAGGNLAGERQVLDRVRFGHHRQVVAVGRIGDAARHRPAHEHPVALEPEVPMQPRRVVLLNHEPPSLRRAAMIRRVRTWRLGGRMAARREGLGRGGGGALGHVRGERIGGGGGEGGEQVAVDRDAREHLVQDEMAQLGVVELGPGARSRDGRLGAPAERIRGDGGLRRVVLRPVDEHLAGTGGLTHRAHDEIGIVRFQGACQFAGEHRDLVAGSSRVQRGIQVNTLGSARHRRRLHAHVRQDAAGPSCHLRAFGEPDAGARVEVEHEAVGVSAPAVVEAPLRRVEFEARDLREVDESGDVGDQRVVLRSAGMVDRVSRHPIGRAGFEVFREEGRLAGAFRPAQPGDRPAGKVRQHHGSDARVVVDHLRLRGARVGIEHFVEVAQTQATPADVDHLR